MTTPSTNLNIKDASIMFRNFSGKEGRFNPPGRRTFCVILDDETAAVLKKDGWNVRYLDPREEGDAPTAYIQVEVSFRNYPPRILLVSKIGKSKLDETSIDILDWAELVKADVVLSPYNWSANGRSGIKAYLRSLRVTISDDDYDFVADDLVDLAVLPGQQELPWDD